jgi:hypothetical protein
MVIIYENQLDNLDEAEAEYTFLVYWLSLPSLLHHGLYQAANLGSIRDCA